MLGKVIRRSLNTHRLNFSNKKLLLKKPTPSYIFNSKYYFASSTLSSSNKRFQSGSNSGNNLTIVDRIYKDHNQIRLLIKQYKEKWNTMNPNDRKTLIDNFINKICTHSEAEEMILYNNYEKLLGKDQGSNIAKHSWKEHEHCKKLLFKIDMRDSNKNMEYNNSKKLEEDMNELIPSLEHHLNEEEQNYLLKVKNNNKVDENELIKMGNDYEYARDHQVPRRPHPPAPDKGALGDMAKKATRPLDDLRDRISGRRVDTNPDYKKNKTT
jgi:hypothetical protein